MILFQAKPVEHLFLPEEVWKAFSCNKVFVDAEISAQSSMPTCRHLHMDLNHFQIQMCCLAYTVCVQTQKTFCFQLERQQASRWEAGAAPNQAARQRLQAADPFHKQESPCQTTESAWKGGCSPCACPPCSPEIFTWAWSANKCLGLAPKGNIQVSSHLWNPPPTSVTLKI